LQRVGCTGSRRIFYDAFAFVIRLPADGSAVLFSIYLGGSDREYVDTLAVDRAGNVWMFGSTTTGNFPTTAGAFDPTYNGGPEDANQVPQRLSDGQGGCVAPRVILWRPVSWPQTVSSWSAAAGSR
jgi:hypothetical protein